MPELARPCIALVLALAACSPPVAPADASSRDVAADRPLTSPDVPASDAADIPVLLDVVPPDAPVEDAARDAAPDAVAPDARATSMFPIVDPPPGFSGLPTMAPVVLTDAMRTRLADVAIQNPDGDCVRIRGGADITLEHLAIGPCRGSGIYIEGDPQRVTIRDVYVHDTGGDGVFANRGRALTITDSHFARNRRGGYFQDSAEVHFEFNRVLNPQGPPPQGKMAQFNRVNGSNSTIRCNLGQNDPGASQLDDVINLYESMGTESSPILVEGNRIWGGGPFPAGGGILLGDGGGAYQIARGNTVVDPGQYGIAVAGGQHMRIEANRVFARQHMLTNVGIYAWNQQTTPCGDVTIVDNQVNWTNRDGRSNPYYAMDCGTITERGNVWTAPITDAIRLEVPAACR